MRVSYRWLRKTLNFEISAETLVDTLTNSGLEVEETTDLGYGGEPIVVAEIRAIEPHPNADQLSIVQVATGEGPLRQVVCGARNFGVGDRAPLALPGAHLASGLKVAETVIRGQKSEGVLCSGSELGWNNDSSGLLLLSKDYETGDPIDFLMDIKITPNRADCVSIFGLARDIAAQFGKKVYPPTHRFTESLDHTESFVSVLVKARDACPRYAGRVVKDVRVGPSPLWLQRKLESVGLRPINNIVDITNFVMFDLGQPMHAFDLDKIANNQLQVRMAEEGERAELINGAKISLTAQDLVIADPVRVLALAGIMGGKSCEITESTTNVFLECACFEPVGVRRTARRLQIATDSSYRFERGVDRGKIANAVNIAAYWVRELASGEIAKGLIDINTVSSAAKPIALSLDRTNHILGLELKGREVADILLALGFEIIRFDHNTMMVNVPTHRVDVTRDVDLIEEVARMYGYNKIPSTSPYLPAAPTAVEPETGMENMTRDILVALGFYETISYSFIPKALAEKFGGTPQKLVTLMNPLTQDQAVMQPSLAPSLVQSIRYNQNRGNRDLRLFEIGHAFRRAKNDRASEENLAVVVGISGVRSWHWRSDRREVDYFDVKGVAEHLFEAWGLPPVQFVQESQPFLHPGRAARMRLNGADIGWLGELHPALTEEMDLRAKTYLLEIDLTACIPHVSLQRRFEDIPKFPAMERDLALVAPDALVSHDLEQSIRKLSGDLLENVQLFDFFKGGAIPKDKKSLTYRLTYRAKDRTLTDQEIDLMQTKVLAALETKFEARLRD